MRMLTGWLPALLVLTVSAALGSGACLAMAEASSSMQEVVQVAQPPGSQGRHTDRGRPWSAGHTHEETIYLHFRNADILQMITMMSELTGTNFLVDSKVRGTITLIAPQPVTRAEAYHIFLAALAMQGFTVVSQGPVSTIVPLRDAKTSPLPTVTDTTRPHR